MVFTGFFHSLNLPDGAGPPPFVPTQPPALSGLSLAGTASISSYNMTEARFSRDGNHVFYNYTTGGLATYGLGIRDMSTPFDVTTAGSVSASTVLSISRPFAQTCVNDIGAADYGKKFYFLDNVGNIGKMTASTAFGGTLTNSGVVGSHSHGRLEYADFYNNGSNLVIFSQSTLWDYSLSTPYDLDINISTGATLTHTDTGFGSNLVGGSDLSHVCFVSRGNYLYAFSRTGDVFLHDSTSAPYDLAQVSLSGASSIDSTTLTTALTEYAFEFDTQSNVVVGSKGYLMARGSANTNGNIYQVTQT